MKKIFSPDCLRFVADLHNQFNQKRIDLLNKRQEIQKQIDLGYLPDFLEETKKQLDSWNVKYNECIVFKPNYDIWIDDKAIGVARDTEGSISDFKPRIEEALSKVQFPSSKE